MLSLHTLFFVHEQIAFKHVFIGMNIPEKGVQYPEGVDSESFVYDFLLKQKKPLAVEITLNNGMKKYLRNRAWYLSPKAAMKT